MQQKITNLTFFTSILTKAYIPGATCVVAKDSLTCNLIALFSPQITTTLMQAQPGC